MAQAGLGGYVRDSRSPRYSLVFAVPLFLLYQGLIAVAPPGPGGGLRNGADVILETLFIWVAGARGPLIFLTLLVVLGLWLAGRDWQAHGRDLRPQVFLLMLLEATVLALIFGTAVATIASQLVRPTAAIGLPAQQALPSLGAQSKLMLSLGAGLYEELLFRVVLVGTLAWAARVVLGLRATVAGVCAAVLGALIFSACHYIGTYGDRFQLYSFVFRTIAGLAFSGLYLLRGFGITAWTHAIYDAVLMLR
ncbi:MAG TPA: CPBP family glutamic-type intramembrane protease [Gemmatimonadales bacterium]|nr:CPBP family glutamic-type intramembrane protease [Gemmatimonadales bacterium]